MKKLSLVIAILMLIAIMPFAALAETGESEKITVYEQLKLDETYDFGEGRTFANGYMPSADAGGTVRIVLPFYKNADVASAVYVTPAITANDAAFEPANTIFGIQNSLPEWKALFDIKVKSACYGGVYPVAFDASYKLPDGTEKTQTFTVYVRVNGKTAADKEQNVSLPKLMVTGYEVQPGQVMAGESIKMDITVKNMSKRDAYYVQLTLSSADGVFLPKGGTNSAYIEKLKGGAEKTLSFEFDVKPDAAPAPASITVDMKYEDDLVNSASAVSVISVPVSQPIRIRVSDALASGYSFDSPFSVELDIVNMGRSTVYNVSAAVTGEGFYSATEYFGGTLAPGESKKAAISAYATMMSEEPMQEFSGSMSVSYEDVNGKIYTEDKPFTLFMEYYPDVPVFEDDPSLYPEMPEVPSRNLTWLWILIGVLVVAGLIVFLSLRAKKRRKEIEDELL